MIFKNDNTDYYNWSCLKKFLKRFKHKELINDFSWREKQNETNFHLSYIFVLSDSYVEGYFNRYSAWKRKPIKL